VWQNGDLCGGLYGVSLGRCFFGESMFSSVSNASKAALIALNDYVSAREFLIIDCQVPTFHLASLGARDIPRKEFYAILEEGLRYPDLKEKWE
jgi:leucyl/phenylalanyl-tRNA--protein transferase